MKIPRSYEKGQVMLLGILVLVALVLAVFILFDVQNLIRGKIKAQSAADAAALAAAEWQKNALNVAGELNLISASTVLISDDLFGIGEKEDKFLNPEKKKQIEKNRERLKETSNLISQLQYRNLFMTPLIGFGAAQAAAKNNGINYNESFCEAVKMQNDMLAGRNSRSILYEPFKSDDYCQNNLFGFRWYAPYLSALTGILMEKNGEPVGIAAMPSGRMIGAPSIYTEPPVDVDFSGYLSSWETFDAISIKFWCDVLDFLDNMEDYHKRYSSSKWWGELRLYENQSFEKESEYLPIRVEVSTASREALASALNFDETQQLMDENGRRSMKPFQTKKNAYKVDPFPELNWAYYKGDWGMYGEPFIQEWEGYLKGHFKQEAAYYSGAVARVDLLHAPGTFLSTLNGEKTMAQGLGQFSSGTAQSRLSRMSAMENAMKNSPPAVWNNALAKPFGKLTLKNQNLPPQLSGIVLPVFDDVSLIPVSLEDPGSNALTWLDWYFFKLEYLPVLGTVNSLSDMPEELRRKYAGYHGLLVSISKSWEKVLVYMNAPVRFDKDGNVLALRRDLCFVNNGRKSNGHGGGCNCSSCRGRNRQTYPSRKH